MMRAFFKMFVLLAAALPGACSDDTTTVVVGSQTGPFPDFGPVLAFPGAEGFGRFATGGRGGEIVHVTNLDASGPGSFADAVSEPGRIVVFDVAGVIDLDKSTVVFKSDQTVLFQTAPGDGVALYNGRVSSSGASNLIVRYMRIRTGRQVGSKDNTDAGGLASGERVIYDHCSFTWGTDENFSINADNKGTRPRNITIQNSIIGQGCMNHSAGGLIQTSDEEGVTIYRNLLIDNGTRNFKIKGLNQYVNNVIYNWGAGAAYNMGGESSGRSLTAIENNYFIKGPCWVWRNTPAEEVSEEVRNNPEICTPAGSDGKYYEVLRQENPARPFTGGNAEFETWCVGNRYDADLDGALGGVEITQSNWEEHCSGAPTFLAARPDAIEPIAAMTSAEEAYAWVVDHVGASLPARDKVDAYMIEELVSLGAKGTILRDQTDPKHYPLADTWQLMNTSSDRVDSDGDGMPDAFEDAYGLDRNDPSDAAKIANNGYANIENYAIWLEDGPAH